MNSIGRKIIIGVAIGCLAAGFGGGYWYHQYHTVYTDVVIHEIGNQGAGKPASVDFGLFWQAWNTLQEKYVDKNKIDAKKALYGAISGMVNSIGDPYTVFFEPVTAKQFKDQIKGEFGGVGMEIGKRNDVLTVIAPIKDSPAMRAGVLAGDTILKINSTTTEGMSVEQAVSLIRGPNGTKVTLTMSRNNTNRVVELIRDTIKIPAVSWKLLDGHIAYMEIFSFSENVDREFENAAQEILKSKADRLIIDLRNNPGGLLDSAVNLAGWFLDRGSIVTTEKFGNGLQNDFRASGSAELKHYPTVFLINGGSASASEILAGAVHDNRGIKLIGQKSYGKGSVQELQGFSDGSSLKVTVAKWLTPSGISISEKGIEADIPVAIDDKQLQAGKLEFGIPGKDPQLDKAVETIKGL